MKFITLLKLFVLLALSAMGLLWALPALAHTELVSASPAPGAIVPPTLAEIRLTFNGPLSPGSTFELLTENFQTVPGLTPQITGSTVSAQLAARLAVGQYTVQWKAFGDDGHTVEGSYPFSVSADAQAATPPWPIMGLAGLVIVGLGLMGYWLYRRRQTADSP